jgi:hypothetical protein
MDDVSEYLKKPSGARMAEHEEDNRELSDMHGLSIYTSFPY